MNQLLQLRYPLNYVKFVMDMYLIEGIKQAFVIFRIGAFYIAKPYVRKSILLSGSYGRTSILFVQQPTVQVDRHQDML